MTRDEGLGSRDGGIRELFLETLRDLVVLRASAVNSLIVSGSRRVLNSNSHRKAAESAEISRRKRGDGQRRQWSMENGQWSIENDE